MLYYIGPGICMAVRRVLTLLIMIMMVLAPSAMVSAAICQHQDAAEHMLARASADATTANNARAEETAASLAKKGVLADAPTVSLLANLIAPFELAPPPDVGEARPRPVLDDIALGGTSVRPLLEPPAA